MASDPYAKIADTDPAVVHTIADRLEVRAANPDQRAMLDAYLGDIEWPADAKVVEIGCGTGPVSRVLAALEAPASVLGVDPSPILIDRARQIATDLPKLSFEVGDARNLAFGNATFDVAILHTALCHIPEPQNALAEAHRVLKPGGWIAEFDGDYASATVALAENDPLQACSRAVTEHNVMDRWIIRRLPEMTKAAGFYIQRFRSHGYAEVIDPAYMLGHAERGAEVLAAQGVIGVVLADALKAEARRRAADGSFFGHIAYASLVARKA